MKDYILRVTTHRSFKVTVKNVKDFDEAWRQCKHWMLSMDGDVISEPCGTMEEIEVEEVGDCGDVTVTPYIPR